MFSSIGVNKRAGAFALHGFGTKQKWLMIQTRHNETGTVALPRLARVAVACGAPVVIQPILRQDVKYVQGSCGCDEISLSWKRPKQERTTMGQCAMQPRTKTLKGFPCADFSLFGTFRRVY